MDEYQGPHDDPETTSPVEADYSPDAVPPDVKRLYRSSDQRIMLGVCGGLGEYFDIDPTIVRVIFVALAIFAGGGILLYIALSIIMPSEDKLEVHPRDAARATVDEAVSESKRAAGRASGWVRQKTGRTPAGDRTNEAP